MMHSDLGLMCADAAPTLWGIFDPAIAPAMLYYSYIPIIVVSLAFALFIFLSSKRSSATRLLLWTAIIFSMLLVGEIMLWISAPVLLIHFVWQIIVILHVLVVACIGYFAYVFIAKRDLPAIWKWVWLGLLAPIFVLAPTVFNLSGFDLDYCESVQGQLWSYVYLVEAFIMLVVVFFTFRTYHTSKEKEDRTRGLWLGIGAALFIGIFLLSYAIGDVFLFYSINLFGPIGMVVFLAALTYLIVEFHAFNLRILGAQAIVAALVAVLFAALFVRTIENVRYVLLGTLLLVLILGTMLVRGVLREVRQREEIEKLAAQLSSANDRLKELDQLKSEFLSVASHQLRAPITAIKGYVANILDQTYGPVPKELTEPLSVVQESTRVMVSSIEDYLNVSRIEQGRMKYELGEVNLADLVGRVVTELTPLASKKGLTLNYAKPAAPVLVSVDLGKIKQVFTNLLDNSIKYTEKGGVSVSLEAVPPVVRFTVSDTGIGISEEEIGNLFAKFTRARDANKVNTTGTGLGLYVAKKLVEGHEGKVWAESDGAGKGSRFIVELPL